MGRTKGAKDKTVRKKKGQPAATPPVTDHAGAAAASQMTDDQQAALLGHHKAAYKKFLEAKKKADADFKNACKLAKAEGVKVDDIKTSIKLETPEGELEIRAAIEAQLRIARWANSPLGHQFGLFPTDDGGNAKNAHGAGRKAGLAGEKPTVPAHMDHALYMAGWTEGNEIRTATVIKQKKEDADEFDAAEKGGSSETEEEAGAEEDAEL